VEVIENGRPTTGLAVLIAWVPNRGDAWTGFALDHLRRTLSGDTDADLEFLPLLEKLGQRTAEMHRALCPAEGVDEAFAPERITKKDLRTWRARIRSDAEEMFENLGRVAGDAAERLIGKRDAVLRQIAGLAEGPIEALKTRIHGDYHLGQVLFTGDDFRIVDFEGEPRRSIEERRAKHSPLKDVAGMLRSFDYAAATALREATSSGGGASELEARAERWRTKSAEAFLRAYRSAIAGAPSYPEDTSSARDLLALLTLEKAIYEVGYELANRPEWVDIPIAGILRLLEAKPSPSAVA
jgi:maltose alpha-D-glucosyltransferase / alpha-amylase